MRRVACILVLALTAAVPSLAEEVIHFTNGTSMAIRGHTVDDNGMIHADLGGDSFIAFPAYQVDSIGEAAASVRLEPSKPRSSSRSTRPMLAASGRDVGRTATTKRPADRLAAHQKTGRDAVPAVPRDANGVAVTRPVTASRNSKPRADFSLTGRGSIGGSARGREDGGRLGSTAVGRREMIHSSNSSSGSPRSQRPRLSGLQKQGK